MRTSRIAVLLAVALLCGSSGAAEKKPRIKILATGGTIAGAALKPTDPGYQSGAVGVDVLINAVPQLKDIADVSGEQIASIGSQDMNDEIWLKLAKRVNELLKSSDVDGIAITHGTDTLEETSYFLDLVTKSDKPVVMTGSMRPSTAMSADGPLNIYNSVAVAADPTARGRGVLVLIDDDIHSAHPNDRVIDAIRKMGDKQVRRIPVVDRDGTLRGIISMADVALETHEDRELAEALEEISSGATFWNRIFG